MKFLYMDICKSSSSPTRINTVIILSGMGCGISSPYHNLATKKISVKALYISI